jgi:AraC family transcriptional regulator
MNTAHCTDVAFQGVVPAVCDAEAGEENQGVTGRGENDSTGALHTRAVDVSRLRAVLAELRLAIHSALNDERGIAEDRLRRASDLLEKFSNSEESKSDRPSGRLAAWQVRKVISHIDANLEGTIRNEDLAALVRLTPSHFGRGFRNSVGEPPHEYVIRRRIERAQGLMLSTQAKLSDIALDCGLADQSHLTRLFRRLVGESPRVWRRSHFNPPT